MRLKLIQTQNLVLAKLLQESIIEALLLYEQDNDSFLCKCRVIVHLWEDLIEFEDTQNPVSNKGEFDHCSFCIANVREFIQKRRRNRTARLFQLIKMSLHSLLKHLKE
jgi:hypothetical protein